MPTIKRKSDGEIREAVTDQYDHGRLMVLAQDSGVRVCELLNIVLDDRPIDSQVRFMLCAVLEE